MVLPTLRRGLHVSWPHNKGNTHPFNVSSVLPTWANHSQDVFCSLQSASGSSFKLSGKHWRCPFQLYPVWFLKERKAFFAKGNSHLKSYNTWSLESVTWLLCQHAVLFCCWVRGATRIVLRKCCGQCQFRVYLQKSSGISWEPFGPLDGAESEIQTPRTLIPSIQIPLSQWCLKIRHLSQLLLTWGWGKTK